MTVETGAALAKSFDLPRRHFLLKKKKKTKTEFEIVPVLVLTY